MALVVALNDGEHLFACGQVGSTSEHGADPETALTIAEDGVDDVVGQAEAVIAVVAVVYDVARRGAYAVEPIVGAHEQRIAVGHCTAHDGRAEVLPRILGELTPDGRIEHQMAVLHRQRQRTIGQRRQRVRLYAQERAARGILAQLLESVGLRLVAPQADVPSAGPHVAIRRYGEAAVVAGVRLARVGIVVQRCRGDGFGAAPLGTRQLEDAFVGHYHPDVAIAVVPDL